MATDNIERYDRQIRLWGQHGQNKCSMSKICLINATSLGTEILKGLCLAGIGSFNILDSHKMTADDVGSNFIPQSSVGKNRGEVVMELLLDLNEVVDGHVHRVEKYLPHVTCNSKIEEDLDRDMDFWKLFDCIIVTGYLYVDQIVKLSKICWQINTPLIVCKSTGFYGSMSSQIREHLTIESHSDNHLTDFYLDKPFGDLKDYFDSISLNDDLQLDKISDYPYVVIVYKFLRLWQSANNLPENRMPSNYSEKKALKSLIEKGLKEVSRRRNAQRKEEEDQSTNDQAVLFENYLEAAKAVNSCLSASNSLSVSLKKFLDHDQADYRPSSNTNRFRSIIKAIREFVRKNDNRLPVSGTIPDMTSKSEEYLKLQTIYSNKAKEDVDKVFSIVQALNDSSYKSAGSTLYEETKLICKNIRDVEMISTRPIYEEYDFKSCTLRGEEEDDEFLTIGLCLKALDLFFSNYGRSPGCQDDQVETDISKLKECVKQILGKMSNRFKTLDQSLYEICRYGGLELHATSAFLGGCVAQEVIKLVTNQYIPVNNTMIYNAMSASVKSYDFGDTFVKL